MYKKNFTTIQIILRFSRIDIQKQLTQLTLLKNYSMISDNDILKNIHDTSDFLKSDSEYFALELVKSLDKKAIENINYIEKNGNHKMNPHQKKQDSSVSIG